MSQLNKSKSNRRSSLRTKIIAASFLVVVPALAAGGGGLVFSGGYIGELPDSWFDGEPCHNGTITIYENFLVKEYQIDVTGMAADNDPNTYIKCTAQANLQTMTCNVGLPDGTVLGCRDNEGPHALPRDGNVVYMQFDPGQTSLCNILIGTGDHFGIANPACREGGGTGGTISTGGSTSSGCDATTAQAVLSTGQSTNIASNACVRLKNETGWAAINPNLQALPGTAAYPVPFTFEACSGSGSSTLTGDYETAYLGDGNANSQTNPGCDIFVQLDGDGSQVSFRYYE